MMADSDGSMWLGGQNLLNMKDDSLIYYPYQDSVLPKNSYPRILSMLKDKEGELFLGLDKGYSKFDKNNQYVKIASDVKLKYDEVREIAFDKNNFLWISDFHYRPAMFALAQDNSVGCIIKCDTSIMIYDTTNSGLPWNFAEVIRVDADNNIWFGTWKVYANMMVNTGRYIMSTIRIAKQSY